MLLSSGLIMFLWVLLFGYVVARLDNVGGTIRDGNTKISKERLPGKNVSTDFEAMQMDGPPDSQPVKPVCEANVNCAFIVYDDKENIINRIFYCGECITGHECTFFFDDQSQSMLIYRCLPTEGTSDGRSERSGRKVSQDETRTWPRVLNLTKQEKRKEAIKLHSRQGLVADVHEL